MKTTISITPLSPKLEDELFRKTLFLSQRLIALSFSLWVGKSADSLTEEEIQKLVDLYYEKEKEAK